MKRSEKRNRLATGVAALCLLGALAFTGSNAVSASVDSDDFDNQAKKSLKPMMRHLRYICLLIQETGIWQAFMTCDNIRDLRHAFHTRLI